MVTHRVAPDRENATVDDAPHKPAIMLQRTWIDKLITAEDTLHVHKILGVTVLAHFVFQLSYFFATGRMHLPWFMLMPHVALHATSFQFKVLPVRPTRTRRNMFIWQELRLHAAIFALRGCAVIWWPHRAFTIVFLTMICADVVTYYCGTANVSTVRGCHAYKKTTPLKRLSAAFFSMSQLGGTLICSGIPYGPPSPILAFCTLPAIQTSAFGMTLLRKNIIRKETWQIVYSAELILAYVAWYRVYGNLWLLPMALAAYAARVMGVSKYILWGVVCTVTQKVGWP